MSFVTVGENWSNFQEVITPLDFLVMTNKEEDIFSNIPKNHFSYQIYPNLFLNSEILYIGIVVHSLILPCLGNKEEMYVFGVCPKTKEIKFEKIQTMFEQNQDVNIFLFKLKQNPIYHHDYQMKTDFIDKSNFVDLSYNPTEEFDKILQDLSDNLSEENLVSRMSQTILEINRNLDETIKISKQIENEINLMYLTLNMIHINKFKKSKDYEFILSTTNQIYQIISKKLYEYVPLDELIHPSKMNKKMSRIKYYFYKKFKKRKKSFYLHMIYFIYVKLQILRPPKRSFDILSFIEDIMKKDLVANIFQIIYDKSL